MIKMNLYIKVLLAFIFLLPSLYSQTDELITYEDYDLSVAQEASEYNIRYSLFVNYGFNFHNSNSSSKSPFINSFDNFETGFGSGINFGGGVQFRYNKDWYYGGRLTIGNLNGEMEHLEKRKITLNGKLSEAELRNYFNTAINILSLSPFVSYSLSQIDERLNVSAGFTLGTNIKSNYIQYTELLSPSYGTFDDGTRIANNISGELSNSSSFLFALDLGVSFDLPLNYQKNLRLIPSINYSHWFISPITDLNGYINQLTAGIAISYNNPPIPPPPPTEPILPSLLALEVPKINSVFTADVNYITTIIDSNNNIETNNKLIIEEFAQSNMKPMLNYIFFDDNSSVIPEKYKLNNTQQDKFDYKKTQRLNALETYYYLLDVIGDRMKQYPKATITLIGTNSNKNDEKGNIKLSQERANVVKEYLINIWNIEEYRIKTEARNLPKEPTNPSEGNGDDENRRVEIYSSDERIIEPIMSFDTISVLKNSNIIFNTNITSTLGISENKLLLISNNQIIKELNLSNKNEDTIIWNLEELKSDFDFNNNLKYQLIVKNKMNEIINSNTKQIELDKITIKAKRSTEQGNDKEYEYYSLILFDFASRSLATKHNKVVDFIKTRIKPTSIVIINGYTDVIGQKDANKRIAQARAEAVAKRLKITDIIPEDKLQINGIGNDELLYDNRTPEGRFYCRTVTITIETPINNE